MAIVEAKNVKYSYKSKDEEGNETSVFALDGVSMDALPGEFIAILGHNGSGKSTFAKQLNALLVPDEGTVFIAGMDTREDKHTLDIRKTAGMVFQNPDNQMVASVVEEEVGFGPENIGVPTDEIWHRVENALNSVGMYAYREVNPSRLSGGQKQRVAIAGILAMLPKCIILDEPTAMLDPKGRRDVLEVLHRLSSDEKVTVILITHNMEEVIEADRVFVMDKGRVVMSGKPEEIFSNVRQLQKLRLDVPVVTKLAYELRLNGLDIPADILTARQLAECLLKLKKHV